MADTTKGTTRRLTTTSQFSLDYIRNEAAMDDALRGFIRSASGWRMVFAEDENDPRPEISDTAKEIVAAAGSVYSSFLQARVEGRKTVALATDSRPTGLEIAGVLARVLLSEGIDIRYLGISAAPEIMAYVRRRNLDGFVYVTASHNPIGHNGLKFGLSDGGVVGGSDAQALIQSFNKLIGDEGACDATLKKAAASPESALAEIDARMEGAKGEALEDYRSFTLEIAAMSTDEERRREALEPLRIQARKRSLGIVADFNGSARAASIDRDLLTSIGIRFSAFNDTPGDIVHTIVPEGQALEPCRRTLESMFAGDSGYLLGYVPDNDGDRGNLVYVDQRTGKAEILRAQEVFALSCVAELAYLVYSGQLTYSSSGRSHQRHAVVVNGPTSLRIDAIAKAFDVQVFRAEVGEANVVSLARDSRSSGFQVRVMGEGSNGGNITHPASVRDPLNTLFSVLKLLLLPSTAGKPGPYEIWCARSGHAFDPKAGIGEMLESLPAFVTTDVNEPRAVVDIKSTDQVRFKEAYEELFLSEWDAHRPELEGRLGVHTWEEINYEGINEVHGFGRSYRKGKQRGGLKILFKDGQGRKLAFIWMRGSGTEPVFRVLADVKGNDTALEQWLLDWHVSMIRRADARVSDLVNASR